MLEGTSDKHSSMRYRLESLSSRPQYEAGLPIPEAFEKEEADVLRGVGRASSKAELSET